MVDMTVVKSSWLVLEGCRDFDEDDEKSEPGIVKLSFEEVVFAGVGMSGGVIEKFAGTNLDAEERLVLALDELLNVKSGRLFSNSVW